MLATSFTRVGGAGTVAGSGAVCTMVGGAACTVAGSGTAATLGGVGGVGGAACRVAGSATRVGGAACTVAGSGTAPHGQELAELHAGLQALPQGLAELHARLQALAQRPHVLAELLARLQARRPQELAELHAGLQALPQGLAELHARLQALAQRPHGLAELRHGCRPGGHRIWRRCSVAGSATRVGGAACTVAGSCAAATWVGGAASRLQARRPQDLAEMQRCRLCHKGWRSCMHGCRPGGHRSWRSCMQGCRLCHKGWRSCMQGCRLGAELRARLQARWPQELAELHARLQALEMQPQALAALYALLQAPAGQEQKQQFRLHLQLVGQRVATLSAGLPGLWRPWHLSAWLGFVASSTKLQWRPHWHGWHRRPHQPRHHSERTFHCLIFCSGPTTLDT